MASDKIKSILSEEGIRSSTGELSFLFRKMCSDIGVTPRRWEFMLQRYLDKALPLTPKNPKDRSYARGNLNSQFTAPAMTWRTFREALKFLGPKGAELRLILDWGHGQFTEHRMSLRARASDMPLLEELMLEDEIPETVLKTRKDVDAPPTAEADDSPESTDPDYVPDV